MNLSSTRRDDPTPRSTTPGHDLPTNVSAAPNVGVVEEGLASIPGTHRTGRTPRPACTSGADVPAAPDVLRRFLGLDELDSVPEGIVDIAPGHALEFMVRPELVTRVGQALA